MRPAALALALALCAAPASAVLPEVRDGDIIFHTSASSQSDAIQRATNSPYSHMGVILSRQGKPFVFEAVATVRFTPLAQWIARGKDRRYALMRLRDPLSPAQIEELRRLASGFEGRPYDWGFEWSDDRIYCSELVWKMYQRALGIELGALQQLRDFRLADPVVRAKLLERYGTSPPLAEPVISPSAIFASPLLESATRR